MSGGAPKEVFVQLTPKFEQQTGNKVVFIYGVLTALREKRAAGEKADVLVMPVPMLDGYAKDGKLRDSSRATFGIVGTSVVVKEGAPKPDISTKDKFRDAMLAARSVVHATPGKTPSGTHMGKMMEQLGIADAMAKKVIHRPALDGGVQLVVEGQAEIGIYSGQRSFRCQRSGCCRTFTSGNRLEHALWRGGHGRQRRGGRCGGLCEIHGRPGKSRRLEARGLRSTRLLGFCGFQSNT